jgi:hypothetical protein
MIKFPLILDSNFSITGGTLDTKYMEWIFFVKNELVVGVEHGEARIVLNVRERHSSPEYDDLIAIFHRKLINARLCYKK